MNYSFCTFIEKKQRVDMYISALFPDISRSYVQKLIDNGSVEVDKKIVKKNIKIENKQVVTIKEIITSTDIEAENIALEIIYEDENIIVINKNAGINTHPTPGVEGKSGTLVNAVLYHCKEQLPVISGEERPGIVHRLDKDTSGAIMIAKNDITMNYLQGIIKERNIKKYYIAIVSGIVEEKDFTIKSYIGRDKNDPTKMTTSDPVNPKQAITHGKVLGYIREKYSVLKIDLQTGRTHQIRVHLASIGYPIIGDTKYGREQINTQVKKEFGLSRQALHAYSLEFKLYQKKQVFIAELKKDMRNIIPINLLA